MSRAKGHLKSFKDNKISCFANVVLASGEPCFVGVAQSGVLVKRSKIGWFGAKLYNEKDVFKAAMTAKALDFIYPIRLFDEDIENPVLAAFVNAALDSKDAAEMTNICNTAIRKVESDTGAAIEDLQI